MAVVRLIKAILFSSGERRNRVNVSYRNESKGRKFAYAHHWLVAINRFRKDTYRVFGVLELQLSGKYTGQSKDFLAGKGKGRYSVADIGTWTWVKNLPGIGFTEEEMENLPHLLKWVERIATRPAVRRGCGEKYKRS
jgi:glutathione S-transferase